MPVSVKRHIFPISAAVALSLTLSACGSGMALTTQRTQGYELSQDALAQIRPGQSQTLVTTVLGSPQVTNSFGEETAFYYIQTKIDRTAFGSAQTIDDTNEKAIIVFCRKPTDVTAEDVAFKGCQPPF